MAAAALGPEINTKIMKTDSITEEELLRGVANDRSTTSYCINTIYFTRKPARNRYCSNIGVLTQMQDEHNMR
jgi:hypothetical protein